MAKKPVKKQVAKTVPPPVQQATKKFTSTPIDDVLYNKPKKGGLSLFAKLCLILSTVTFLVYVNSLWNGYVLDDVMVLKDNKFVMLGLKAIPEIFSTPHMRGYLVIPNDLYRPFSLAVFAVEYQFLGPKPMADHFFNILTYIGCVLVFFTFINKFFDNKKIVVAFVCALIFALHPIHTEVVANIKSRDELLCFLFAFLTLNLFMDYVNTGKVINLLVGCFTLFIAYLSKETVLTFTLVIPFLFFFTMDGNKNRSAFITIGSVVIMLVYLDIRYQVLKIYNANQSVPVEFIDNALSGAPNAIVKFFTEILIMGYYLRMMFIPYPLISNYSFNSIHFVEAAHKETLIWVFLTSVAYGLMIFTAIYRFINNKKDPWAFGIVLYFATISLFSNFPFLMGAEVAERFTFFASAGTCILMALAIDKWILKDSGNDILALKTPNAIAVLCVICVPFTGLTFMRNFDWKTNATLYRADLAKSPEDSRLNYYLGTAMAEGVYDSETDTAKRHEIDKESIEHLRRSLSIYTNYTEANAEIGRVFYREGKYDSAEKHDKKALEINPNHVTANNNLGSVYLTLARYPEAIALFRKTVTLDPGYNFAYFNMARAYMQLKKYDSAIINFRITLSFNEKNLDAQQEMGMAYYYQLKWDSAAVHFKAALELNPNDANAVNNLGAIYLNNKKYPEAIQYFQRAISINPNYINACSNLAKSYYFSGQYANAINMVFNDLKIAPKYYSDFPYIALSYQKLGKMDSARKYEALAKQIYSNFKLE